MLSLLLDENMSPEIVNQIVLKRPDIPVVSVHQWHEGRFKAKSDEAILLVAAEEGLTLVTYDQSTIPPVLTRWGLEGVDHAGVVFIDQSSMPSKNIGLIVKSLTNLWDSKNHDLWVNRIDFLRRNP